MRPKVKLITESNLEYIFNFDENLQVYISFRKNVVVVLFLKITDYNLYTGIWTVEVFQNIVILFTMYKL